MALNNEDLPGCAAPLDFRDWEVRCDRCGHHPASVTPADAARTLRSLPRRIGNRLAAVHDHEPPRSVEAVERIEQLRRHLAEQASSALTAWPGAHQAGRVREEALDVVVGELAERLDNTTAWAELLEEGGRDEQAWALVSQLVHDAVHHLRDIDRDLHSTIPELRDVDLDAGNYNDG